VYKYCGQRSANQTQQSATFTSQSAANRPQSATNPEQLVNFVLVFTIAFLIFAGHLQHFTTVPADLSLDLLSFWFSHLIYLLPLWHFVEPILFICFANLTNLLHLNLQTNLPTPISEGLQPISTHLAVYSSLPLGSFHLLFVHPEFPFGSLQHICLWQITTW
jgi:hypothetical protein